MPRRPGLSQPGNCFHSSYRPGDPPAASLTPPHFLTGQREGRPEVSEKSPACMGAEFQLGLTWHRGLEWGRALPGTGAFRSAHRGTLPSAVLWSEAPGLE